VKTKADLPLAAFGERSLSARIEAQLPAQSARMIAPLITAYFELDHLKQLYRQGWLLRGVPPERCESVADHIFGMAVLAWWILDVFYPAESSANPDRDTVIRMALAHELGEIYTGDLVPGDAVPPAEKHRREREGLWQVVGKLPKGEEYLALWEEYEAGETPEARFVKQVDRLEMALQARVYQQQGFTRMDEFYASAEAALTDPALQEIFTAIKSLG
jgi:putative hydrolases of HD superfamily